jgi:acyl-coenzyme A synthetase/AMP-(fatty) acid ligase
MTPWTGDAAPLAQAIADYIDGDRSQSWEALALAIHRYQVARDPVLAALVERPVHDWTDIPAVPVGVFKTLPVGTISPDAPSIAFRTSGTTGGGRGVHRLHSTALYDRGAIQAARRALGPRCDAVVALLEDPAHAPDASLSHMVALFGPVGWWVRSGQLDVDGANQALADARGEVLLATTAFAAAEWLMRGAVRAPPGARAMVTGGFKGRIHSLSEPELVDALRALGFDVVLEYGMTELSSQLWARPGAPYEPPPWLRVRAVDPVHGGVLPPGALGQLRFWDLANLDGTLAIETMDQGEVDEAGRVRLHGRLAGSPPRGCSLTVEEAWARRG